MTQVSDIYNSYQCLKLCIIVFIQNNDCSLQNVWRYDSIPSNEELCKVTVSVSDTNDGVIYSDSAVCSFTG